MIIKLQDFSGWGEKIISTRAVTRGNGTSFRLVVVVVVKIVYDRKRKRMFNVQCFKKREQKTCCMKRKKNDVHCECEWYKSKALEKRILCTEKVRETKAAAI